MDGTVLNALTKHALLLLQLQIMMMIPNVEPISLINAQSQILDKDV